MIPQPLHPAVVHFPIVLALLLPIVAGMALFMIRRKASIRMAWVPVVLLTAGLALSSWVALQTGEQEEEAVESVVAESVIHEHEEAAELFFWLSVGTLFVVSAGLWTGRTGTFFRIASLVAGLGLSAAVYQTGHTGGALVYEHGAAAAHATLSSDGYDARSGAARSERDDRGDDEDEHRD